MPAAAVIPAPIAYIKVVAVKKLVVECGVRDGCCWGAVVALPQGGLLQWSIVPTLLIGGQCSRALVFADLNACIRRVSLYWGAC